MNDRIVALRVGIVLLAAGFITGFMIILLGEGRTLLQSKYTVHLKFPQAPGVAVDTPVRKDGVLIGRVSHVEPRDEGGVMISARIDAERKIFKNELAQIRSSSLLGDSVLEFILDRNSNQPHEPFQDGDFLGEGRVASDPIQVITNLEMDVRKAVQSIELAANNVSLLSTRLQTTLGTDDGQLTRLMQKSETALDQIQRTAHVFENLVGDPEITEHLKQGVRELPKTMQDLQSLVAATRETLDGFKGMQQRVEQNLDSIQRFTQPLGEHGEEMIGNVNRIVENVESMTAIGADLAERIRNADGSLARLIRDDDLYDKVLETVDNVREASRQLRPILSDARVISDKLARDPGGELGLKRALDNRPVGAGIKGLPAVRDFRLPWQEEE